MMSNKFSKYQTYGLWGMLGLLSHLLKTRLFFTGARLIRFPIDVRGKKYIDFGRALTTGYGCRIEAFPVLPENGKLLIFGANVEINDYVHIAAGEKITIGNNVLIASKVFISDINHGKYSGDNHDSPFVSPNSRKLFTKPVCIEDNVWIGEGVCIMAGVTIGFGSVIGALSVVTKSIAPNSIAVGTPAKIIKQFDFEKNQWSNLI